MTMQVPVVVYGSLVKPVHIELEFIQKKALTQLIM